MMAHNFYTRKDVVVSNPTLIIIGVVNTCVLFISVIKYSISVMALYSMWCYRCDVQDSLMAFVHIDGRMEKIDSFCGSKIPKPVMSNGPRLKLEFHGLLASRFSRGFKASFSFSESKYNLELQNYSL